MAVRPRQIILACASVGLVALMLGGCLFLWIGVPFGWLWIGSQVQGSASLGTALIVTMAGIVVTIFAVITVLSWLNRRHAELRERLDGPRGWWRRGGRSSRPPRSDRAYSSVVR